MFLRISLFISLVTIFYFYCQNDEQSKPASGGELFQQNVPSQNSPAKNYELMPRNTITSDSSINYISARQTSLFSSDQFEPGQVTQN
jgi:hypothetical protein